MMFQAEHIEMIRNGEKTQTRRDWSPNYSAAPATGDVRMATPASEGPFVSHEECDCYIRVTDISEEELGSLSEADAAAEGGYSVEEFRELWEELNDEWVPELLVTAVSFEYVGRSRPEGETA